MGWFGSKTLKHVYTICEIDDQSMFDAWNRAHKASALGQSRGMGQEGRWEGRLGWGDTCTLWLIHVNVWQNPAQYYKVISLQLIQLFFFLKKDQNKVLTQLRNTLYGFNIRLNEGEKSWSRRQNNGNHSDRVIIFFFNLKSKTT